METLDGAAPAAPKTPLVAFVAKFDHDGIFWPPLEPRRLEAVNAGDVVFGDPALKDVLPAGALYVGESCDNAGGRYKWDGQRFVPLPREQRKAEAGVPTLEQAVYDYFSSLDPAALPKRSAAWCEWFRRSMDERGKKGGS